MSSSAQELSKNIRALVGAYLRAFRTEPYVAEKLPPGQESAGAAPQRCPARSRAARARGAPPSRGGRAGSGAGAGRGAAVSAGPGLESEPPPCFLFL